MHGRCDPQPGAPTVRLYTRDGCSLCAATEAELAPLVRAGRLKLVVVDLALHPELEARYGASIPVLEHAGRPFAKGRFRAAEALERLERRRAR